MKKCIVLSMALILFLTGAFAFADESWLEPYEETVTVTFGRYGASNNPLFPEGESLDNSAYTKWIKEQFNIEFVNEWLVPQEDIDSKISLAMASGELPDMFVVHSKTQLAQMIEGGMLKDLTESIELYSSDLAWNIYESHGGLEGFFSDNVRDEAGRIYGVTDSAPGYEFTLTWIRKDWLDRLSLPAPTTWQELEDTARAFVENKLGGENTVGIEITNKIDDVYGFAASPGQWFHNRDAYLTNWLIDESTGKYVYGSLLPGNRDALDYMAYLYSEGLIDPEFATKDWSASIIAGQSGITFGSWWIGAWPLANSKANDPEAEWMPLWILDDDGEYKTYKPDIDSSSWFWVVNAQFENPEVLIKMTNIAAEQQNLYGIEEYDEFTKHIPNEIDTHYSDIGYKFDYHAWPVNSKIRHYEQLLKLEPVWMDLVNRAQAGEEIPEFATESFDGKKIVDYMNGKDNSSVGLHVYCKTQSLQLIAENRGTLVEQEIYVPRVTPTMELAWSNLQDLEAQTFIKIVMGEEPIDAFDRFVEQWYAQGGAQITDEVNAQAGK